MTQQSAVDVPVRSAAPARRPSQVPAVVLGGAALAGLIAAIALVGWLAHVAVIRELGTGQASMKFTTAVALLVVSSSYLLRGRIGLVLAAVGGAIGMLVVVEYVFDIGLGIDQLVVHDGQAGLAHPGRPSVTTAAVIVALAAARVLLRVGRGRAAQSCALLVLIVGTLICLGYAYDVRALYAIRPLTTVSLATGLASALTSLAALASVEDGVLPWAVYSPEAGAGLVRRLFPLALLGLPVLGYLCLVAQRHGWVRGGATIAAFVVACAVAVGALTWVAARRLDRVDRRREQADAEVVRLQDELTRQVQARARQLERRGDQIAITEERQRIAADLHDIVIQRLFAAGMYLQTGLDDAGPDLRERIDTAVLAMDGAIKDLRKSIFQLGAGPAAVPVDLLSAIDDVSVESARILGFVPDALVDDPDLQAEVVRADVLAVVRESLSNVAQHAEASSVEIVLRVERDVLTLTVTDDGVGMDGTGHRSGTRNMAERARARGGTCCFEPVQPRGTRIRWEVPLAVAPPL